MFKTLVEYVHKRAQVRSFRVLCGFHSTSTPYHHTPSTSAQDAFVANAQSAVRTYCSHQHGRGRSTVRDREGTPTSAAWTGARRHRGSNAGPLQAGVSP